MDLAEVESHLRTTISHGLTQHEVDERRSHHGPNALPAQKTPSMAARLIAQFKDPTVMALLVAALIAVALGWNEQGGLLHRFGDAIAIGLITVLNAVISLVQEGKAEKALRSLEELKALRARVRRSAKHASVAAEELVPGDVVLVDKGDRVPADLRLVHSSDLSASEAVLSGESEPVDKSHDEVHAPDRPLAERSNMLFSGTLVARGRAEGIAVATGAQTEFGRLAVLLGTIESPTTPLQQRLRRFGSILVVACLGLGVLVVVLGLLRHQAPLSVLLLTGISLAVAAVPEGLPAITTVVLALGVQRMASRNAIVRRLSAVEALGGANIICTDKTGTLTEGRMRARQIFTPAGEYVFDGKYCYEPDALGAPLGAIPEDLSLVLRLGRNVLGARISESAEGFEGDPTDVALLELGVVSGAPGCHVLWELPFTSDRKRASVCIEEGDGRACVLVHGAPERVLEKCSRISPPDGTRELSSADREAIQRKLETFAAQGFRVLGMAQRTLEGHATYSSADEAEIELTFIGLVALRDPPREEVPRALRQAAHAGVHTVMITGDHPRTALAIAHEIGLGVSPENVATGPDIEALSEEALRERCEHVRVIARATAATKLRFVRALRAKGHVVAMTGDGVNDAPALKAATIGVAMGKVGTEVARDASDLVLTDDNYATIVAAIEEGRNIFANIRRFIAFLLTANTGLTLTVLGAALLGWPPAILPTQILWINLITNGLPALALGMEPISEDLMKRRPERHNIVQRSDVVSLLVNGVWMGVLGLFVFDFYRAQSLALAQTMTFTVMALGPLFFAFASRSKERSLFELGVLSNPRLCGAFAVALGLQGLALFVPGLTEVFHTVRPSLSNIAVACAVASSCWLVGEAQKKVAASSAATVTRS
jgi:Ca2+-transporting ATPase